MTRSQGPFDSIERAGSAPLEHLYPPTWRARLGVVRLWADDLLRMEEVLRNAYGRLDLITDKYRLQSLSQLKDAEEKRLRRLKISADNGRVVLELSRFRAVLLARPKRDGDLEAADRIREIADTHRGLLSRAGLIDALPYLAGMLLAIGFTITALSTPKLASADYVALGVGALLSVLIGIYMLLYRTLSGCRMYTRSWADHPPFLTRNRDEVLLNAIFFVAGVILGWIVKRLASNPAPLVRRAP